MNMGSYPWEHGEGRVTPCCRGNSFLLDNTQTSGPQYSRWECEGTDILDSSRTNCSSEGRINGRITLYDQEAD
jgi:hypothetical protein